MEIRTNKGEGGTRERERIRVSKDEGMREKEIGAEFLEGKLRKKWRENTPRLRLLEK